MSEKMSDMSENKSENNPEEASVRFLIPSSDLTCDGAECIAEELDARYNLHEQYILRRWLEDRGALSDGHVPDLRRDRLFSMELGPDGDPWRPTALELYDLIDWNRRPFSEHRDAWLEHVTAELNAQIAAMRVGERRVLVFGGVELIEVMRLSDDENEDPVPGEYR